MIHVAIVEDREMIREGLQMLIDGTEGYVCSAAYESCEAFLDEVEELKPDVVLMDVDLPGISGIEGIKRLKEKDIPCAILVLTVYEENEMIFKALCAGAVGYLVKKTPPVQLLQAIREAHNGGAPMSSHIARKVVDFFQKNQTPQQHDDTEPLTPREQDVLERLVNGESSRAISESLGVSLETVRFHYRNIYRKLHVHSKSEAVAKALRTGMI